MNAAVVAIGRMENQYAREFVEHHLRLGFSYVIICDNNHDGEEYFQDVLSDYILSGNVIIEDYRNQVAAQRRAYAEIYEKYEHRIDWFAFFDFDEHLYLRHGCTLADLLNTSNYVVTVNWQCYGDNGLVKNDRRPLSERFTKPLPHPLYVQYTDHAENDHVKSIIRSGLRKICFNHNPHVIGSMSPFRKYDPQAKAVLRHYITKTAEEWADKMTRGTGARTYEQFLKAYGPRFFKYNTRTPQKEKYMKQTEQKKVERTVAIVHYNTPELTECTIRSLRKHGGEDYKVVVFDNSDERPFKKRMKGVKRIDNTKSQIIDFDKELAKYPNKDKSLGVDGACFFGSDKHMMTIQKLFELIPEGFLLMDSDILIKASVDFMFQPDRTAVGHVQTSQTSRNPFGIERLMPILCYINVPLCRKVGLDYFDPKRAWGLQSGGKSNRNNWYDTGASFLEDIKKHPGGTLGRRIDIRPLMEHLKSGSWRHSLKQQGDWLKKFENLWK